MGAGASRYTSVEDAVRCGVPHTDIDNHLTRDMEVELETINRCFTKETHIPSSATACGRAAQKTLEQLGFDPARVLYANSVCRDELAVEECWWRYFDGRSADTDRDTRSAAAALAHAEDDGAFPARFLRFSLGGLGGLPAAGKSGLETCASHAFENGGCIFLFVASHVGVDDRGACGCVLHENQEKPSPCCAACGAAWKWASKGSNASKRMAEDPDDAQMDALKRVVAESHARISLSGDEPRGSAAELAEVVYEAIHRRIVALIPDHLAHSVPVVLCGGVQINTGKGKPDFFAPRHFEIYSPSTNPPNDAMAAYRANLKTLILYSTDARAEASPRAPAF